MHCWYARSVMGEGEGMRGGGKGQKRSCKWRTRAWKSYLSNRACGCPLAHTQEKGKVRATARRSNGACIARRSPLTPALSPEYGGEGVNAVTVAGAGRVLL